MVPSQKLITLKGFEASHCAYNHIRGSQDTWNIQYADVEITCFGEQFWYHHNYLCTLSLHNHKLLPRTSGPGESM